MGHVYRQTTHARVEESRDKKQIPSYCVKDFIFPVTLFSFGKAARISPFTRRYIKLPALRLHKTRMITSSPRLWPYGSALDLIDLVIHCLNTRLTKVILYLVL